MPLSVPARACGVQDMLTPCTVMVRKGHLRSAATAPLLLQSFTLWALVLEGGWWESRCPRDA